MAYNTQKCTILFGVESVAGTLETLGASSSCVAPTSIVIPKLESKRTESTELSAFHSQLPATGKSGKYYSFTIETLLRFSNADDGGGVTDPAKWFDLLKPYFTVTDASESMVPNSNSTTKLSFYIYIDSLCYKIPGCLLTDWSINMTANEAVTMSFSFVGMYAEPVQESAPSPTYDSGSAIMGYDCGFTIGSLAASSISLESFGFTLGAGSNPIYNANKTDDGIQELTREKRSPSFTCSVEAWAPTVNIQSTENIYAAEGNGTLLPWSITFGQSTNNQMTLSGSYAQIDEIGEGDSNNRLYFSGLTCSVRSNNGTDNDFALAWG